MMCPSCRQDERDAIEVRCLNEDGERMVFRVCGNCDYGINEHTEGECGCEPGPLYPEELTEAAIVEAMCDKDEFYQEFDDFAHDCHSVSLGLVRSGLLGEGGPNLRVARGACIGVGSQHSWVVLGHPYDPKATIVDLTLWSYDNTKPRVWVGDMTDGLHRPLGYSNVLLGPPPYPRGGDLLDLDTSLLEGEAQRFVHMLGMLDAAGWAALWSRCGMLGWPAREVLEWFIDQERLHAALVPIDIVGMLTDRNPSDLYW